MTAEEESKDVDPYLQIIGLDAQLGALNSLAFTMYFKLNFQVITGLPVVFHWMAQVNFFFREHTSLGQCSFYVVLVRLH